MKTISVQRLEKTIATDKKSLIIYLLGFNFRFVFFILPFVNLSVYNNTCDCLSIWMKQFTGPIGFYISENTQTDHTMTSKGYLRTIMTELFNGCFIVRNPILTECNLYVTIVAFPFTLKVLHPLCNTLETQLSNFYISRSQKLL